MINNNHIIKSSLVNLSNKFILVSKLRIKSWKGILIIGFIAGFASALMFGASQKWLSEIEGASLNAKLYLSPSSASYKVGEEFKADILMDTVGQNVVAAGVYLNFDSKSLEILSLDYTNSVFPPEYAIENLFDNTKGIIRITRGQPSPGVNIDGGKIATVRFKALALTVGNKENVSFLFTRPGASGDSNVHLDDGSCPAAGGFCTGATDILGLVINGRYKVISPSDAPPIHTKIKIKLDIEGIKEYTGIVKLDILDRVSGNIVKDFNINTIVKGRGEINAADLPRDIYDIKVKVPNHLSVKLNNISLPNEDIEFALPQALAGNLQNDDDEINSLDWSIMSGKWGSSDKDVDFNEDGIVNSLDWSFMNKNWGKKGGY